MLANFSYLWRFLAVLGSSTRT